MEKIIAAAAETTRTARRLAVCMFAQHKLNAYQTICGRQTRSLWQKKKEKTTTEVVLKVSCVKSVLYL